MFSVDGCSGFLGFFFFFWKMECVGVGLVCLFVVWLGSWSNSCILCLGIGWSTSGRWDCLNLLGYIQEQVYEPVLFSKSGGGGGAIKVCL